ncbi:MAG: PP0621 family protein [Pseudomonadales bacterium]|nr:PP0621 family protein [Pseudomonadales bacterium]
MGLIRLLTFALVIWLLWGMVKNYQARKKATHQHNKATAGKEKMVKCQQCSVHLPKTQAQRFQDNWFCSEQHKQRFLEAREK